MECLEGLKISINREVILHQSAIIWIDAAKKGNYRTNDRLIYAENCFGVMNALTSDFLDGIVRAQFIILSRIT
jgi:hypothetical protein